jgi:hypothetical protein
VGTGSVNDALPERGLRSHAYEERYGAGKYVAVRRGGVALGAETEVGAGDDCYVSVGGLLYFYFCFSFAIALAIDKRNMLTVW